MSTNAGIRIEEPILDADEIQGITLPGFTKPHQILLGMVIDKPDAARIWLHGFAGQISSLREVLIGRQKFRELKATLSAEFARVSDLKRESAQRLDLLHLSIHFSYPALCKLRGDAPSFESDAFRIGLAERSAFLGDPIDPADPGSPQNWVVGGPHNGIDVLIVVASDTVRRGKLKADELVSSAQANGLTVRYQERSDVLPGELHGHEQFGFHDNVSQPGVRGRISEGDAEVYIQPRKIAPEVIPDSLLEGYPGQQLIWPGEFVIGYPAQSEDPLIAAPATSQFPDWTRNGSYMVFRRLRQDVRLFWQTMREEAARIAASPGFSWVSPLSLASRVVGRWPSGAPVSRVPGADDPALGNDDLANNHFRYGSNTCPVALVGGHTDAYPNAAPDPIGLVCPMAAHIRKVNTRDTGNDDGGTLATYTRRILRRGLPYGTAIVEGFSADDVKLKPASPDEGERGLLFLGVVASIEDQFEFLRNRWMSNRAAPRSPGGDDVFIGLNGNLGQQRRRESVLFGSPGASAVPSATVSTSAAWLVPTGGAYLFTPSISVVRDVLGKAAAAGASEAGQ